MHKLIVSLTLLFSLLSGRVLSQVSGSELKNSSTRMLNEKKTVIVIGAGVSGLTAAKKLQDLGRINVIVLESQSKVGGRTRTDSSLNGISFDEGASWIHGHSGNPITSLAQQAGMNHFVTDLENIQAYDSANQAISDNTFSSQFTTFFQKVEEVAEHGSSSENFIDVFNERNPGETSNRLWKYFISLGVAFNYGDPDKLSSVSYGEGKQFSGEERLIVNGYDKLCNYLKTGLDIKLNERVSKIDHSGSKVKVTHGSLVTEADHVLITVPLGVLKSGNIEFVPPLPTTKLNSMSKLEMNCNNKFLLVWTDPNFHKFWGNEHYFAHAASDRYLRYVHFLNFNAADSNVKGLMTFAHAGDCRDSESLTDNQVRDEIMGILRTLFGDNNIPNPDGFLRTKWSTNPNSFGAYSFPGVGATMKDYETMAEQVGNKLFFAGEHTTDYFGTVHGAHLSGLREADKIIAAVSETHELRLVGMVLLVLSQMIF